METSKSPVYGAASSLKAVSAVIGHLLVESGKISNEDVLRIVAAQQESGLRFGDAAVQLGLLAEDDILRALSQQFDYPVVDAGATAFAPDLVAALQPYSREAEVLRTLRSRLMLMGFGDERKTLALTAAEAGVGCSRLAANLAITFAQLDQRVLLIDTDFRAPAQHAYFGVDDNIGLSNVLAGRAVLENALIKLAPFKQFYLLPAGPPPPNPQELLSRANFSTLLNLVDKRFDIVIVDTQAAAAGADAQLVAARSKHVLLAARKHRTRLKDLRQLKELLTAGGSTLVGSVMID